MGLDVCLYDYNGALYAFGVVYGYSNVKAVRMYVSDGNVNSPTHQYYSTQIYTKDEAGIMDSFGTNAFVFNIRTDRDAEGGAIRQLPYNVRDPEDSSQRGHYRVSFHFYSSTTAGASPLNSTPLTPTGNGNADSWYQMHNSLTTPQLTFDASTKKARLSSVGDCRYIIEVKRRDRNKVNTEFSEEVKDYAYTVGMKGLEGTMGGRYAEPTPTWVGEDEIADGYQVFCRYQNPWYKRRWNLKALVLFDSGADFTDTQKSSYLAMAKNAFSQIEAVTGMTISVESKINSTYIVGDPLGSAEAIDAEYGWYDDFGDLTGIYDMFVRVGNKSTFGGDYAWGGFWTCYAVDEGASEGIHTSVACVDVSYTAETLEHVFAEEIFQSLNIGADNFEYPMSRHWDPHYANPNNMNQKDRHNGDVCWDKEVLRFFYSKNLNGYTPIDLINEMDTPCCLFKDYDGSPYYEFDLSGLVNDEYEITGWVAKAGENYGGGGNWSRTSHYNWDGGWDDAPYSLKTSLRIDLKGDPTPWDWGKSNGYADAEQTAAAYDACLNQKSTKLFSHDVWNDIVNKVQDFLAYTGRDSWTIGSNNYGCSESTTYGSLITKARISDSDTKIYALKFNILRFCIGVMSTFNNPEENNSIYQHYVETGSWDMAKGEKILGSYILDLTNKINQIL